MRDFILSVPVFRYAIDCGHSVRLRDNISEVRVEPEEQVCNCHLTGAVHTAETGPHYHDDTNKTGLIRIIAARTPGRRLFSRKEPAGDPRTVYCAQCQAQYIEKDTQRHSPPSGRSLNGMTGKEISRKLDDAIMRNRAAGYLRDGLPWLEIARLVPCTDKLIRLVAAEIRNELDWDDTEEIYRKVFSAEKNRRAIDDDQELLAGCA